MLMVSKALTVAAYHGKLRALGREGDIDLLAVVPDAWMESGRRHVREPVEPQGYAIETLRLRLNGRFHLYTFRGLGAIARRFRPDIIHVDEEPYNVAAAQACRIAGTIAARCVFFAWQNLVRRLPPPFGWIERYVYARSAGIAGTPSAARVLRAKGFDAPLRVIPQFGIDLDVFAPWDGEPTAAGFRVGYAGRLVPAKGVEVLIRATAGLGSGVRLKVAGSGPAEPSLRTLAARHAEVSFVGALPSDAMPKFYRGLDVFVLPTTGRRGWTEQFGRAAVEAMACGVPVVVSDAGELPQVIGDAGRVVPAGDVGALTAALEALRSDPDLRRRLAAAGRAHVAATYTEAHVAAAAAAFYREILR